MKSRPIAAQAVVGPLTAAAGAPVAAPLTRHLAEVVSAALGPRSLPELERRVLALHAALAAAPSLAPSPRINAAFGELVALTNAADEVSSRVLLANPRVAAIVPELRALCARGEAELEAHWARRILASRDPRRELRNFPYYGNYEKLARLEIHALRGVTTQPLRRAVFIGSGPLPLSSLLMGSAHGLRVDNLDIDAEAVRLGREVARALGLDKSQRFLHGDIDAYPRDALRATDVVCVAALAGLTTTQKTAIVDVLAARMRPGAVLMVRSADRLRWLLYPAVEPSDVRGFEPLSLVQPLNDVVNSILVLEKPL